MGGTQNTGLMLRFKFEALSNLALAIEREHGHGTSVPREWADKYLKGPVHVNGRDISYSSADLLYLVRSASLLEESADGSLRFTHQLLQEYFAAVALLRLGVKSTETLELALHAQSDLVLILLAGFVSDATALINLIIPIDIYLAAKCLCTTKSVQNDTREVVISRLLKKLSSRFDFEFEASVQALSELQAQEAIPALALLLRSAQPHSSLGNEIIRALCAYPADLSIPQLLPLLRDPNSAVRDMTTEILGKTKSRAIIPHLITLLNDEFEFVRIEVSNALSALKSEDVIPYFNSIAERQRIVRPMGNCKKSKRLQAHNRSCSSDTTHKRSKPQC